MSMLLLRLLADASLRISVVALLVAAILSAVRVRSSAVRHAAWTAVLCTMLLMPALPYVVPPIGIPVTLPYVSDPVVVDHPPAVTDSASPSNGPTLPAARVPDERAQTAGGDVPIASSPGSSQQWQPVWPDVALFVYGFGSLILLSRCWIGWRHARRLGRSGQPVRLMNDHGSPTIRIVESGAILTPVTVSILAPTILLPLAWRTWSETRLRAILAHELAHVLRRDPLVACLAQVNRCLFWFHPLAWWLPRTLACNAEQACDAAAIHAIGDPREYARTLLDITRAVGEGGGRVSWHGMSIGGGLLGRRIDRIVGGDLSPRLSTARTALVASTCAAAVVLVAACRPQSTSPRVDDDSAIEQRDHKLRRDLRRVWDETGRDFGRVDWENGAGQIEPLEAALKQDPDNLDALRDLLLAYWIQPDAEKRRMHILRLIERHPETALAGSIEARIFASDRHHYAPFAVGAELGVLLTGDPDGYERAKNLWLAHASRPDVTATILGSAASFFESSDKPLAEQMLIRARALDPQGPWSARLGQFYATVLVGSEMPFAKNVLLRVTVGEPRSAYGLRVRRMLGESTDDVLLAAAGWFLMRSPRDPWTGFDPVVWAASCFKRAMQVNPHAVLAHTEFLKVRTQRTNGGEALWSAPPALQYDAIAALPEGERFELLPNLARSAIRSLGDLARWDDPNLRDRRELARQQARKYAEDALRLAPKYRRHPRAGLAIYIANMTLGTLAFEERDRKAAVDFLRKAAQAPASEELVYSDHLVFELHWHLASDLLKAGEREPVLRFLERMAEINLADRTELREAAAAIRRGETPRL